MASPTPKTHLIPKPRPGSKPLVKKKASTIAAKSNPRSQIIAAVPPGYIKSSSGSNLIVPSSPEPPVAPSKIRQGLREVKRQIDETLDELMRTMTVAYEIREIKLIASFNAEGKFLGFGAGGAASIEITICPCKDA